MKDFFCRLFTPWKAGAQFDAPEAFYGFLLGRDKLLGTIGDAIVDGLLGAISAVLKLIFKLFTTILGWIIWLVSQVLTLFPFLPPGLGALLIGGVVVCFIIGLIKFIRG